GMDGSTGRGIKSTKVTRNRSFWVSNTSVKCIKTYKTCCQNPIERWSSLQSIRKIYNIQLVLVLINLCCALNCYFHNSLSY
uniref:Uncharacterized protein n=1 Tax=Cyanistes caeruleus TaxID=156563 RepID=A0A8C0UWH5_CYACU